MIVVIIMETVKESARIILKRLAQYFKRVPHTEYCIVIVDDSFDRSFNFFIDIKRRQFRQRSIPLHSVTNYSLDNLEQVLHIIRASTNLPIHFRNFQGRSWPISGHRISNL